MVGRWSLACKLDTVILEMQIAMHQAREYSLSVDYMCFGVSHVNEHEGKDRTMTLSTEKFDASRKNDPHPRHERKAITNAKAKR